MPTQPSFMSSLPAGMPVGCVEPRMRPIALMLYGLGLWLTALWLGWLLLAKVDFFYPLFYRLLDIPTTLATYVPQNRHGRQDFMLTDAAEHARLFAAITQAIRQQGRGLETLTYRDSQGRELGGLLTPDEIAHLKDVAHLVTWGEQFGLWVSLGWIGLMLWMRLARIPPPRLGSFLGVSLSIVVGMTGGVLLLGPTELFYAWHRWIFPPDHPWFFYYQDSLMSSLMQAPNLFGVIALAWLGLSMLLGLGLHALLERFGLPCKAR